MKAVRLLEYGGQLTFDDVPKPMTAGDEVLVKVRSTAVNHLDLVEASGRYPIASELFGHEKGAFTGAGERRIGRFEAADGGTLSLDEIGDLPPETQITLLRVLQEREFERIGSTKSVQVDVRILAEGELFPEKLMDEGDSY